MQRWMSTRVLKHPVYHAVHSGLIMLIPVLLTGAFALALQNLPIPHYLRFLATFLDGFLLSFLKCIYKATFSLLSVYATLLIGLSYGREMGDGKSYFGNIAASLIAFFIMSGVNSPDFILDSLGPKGMFIALIAGVFGSMLYGQLRDRCVLNHTYSDSVDVQLNATLLILMPLILTTAVFALLDILVCKLSGVSCLYELFILAVNSLFAHSMSVWLRSLLYLLTSSCLWFLGIHGSDCLEGVADAYFIPCDRVNIAAVAAGQPPVHIFTKGFFDVFVLMGGCGTALCLLIALLLFSKRRSSRVVSKLAVLPMLFNINEVMIFGLPVILNPIMLVPFLCVPLLCFTVSALAMKLGLVPLVQAEVEWTILVLMGGYIATGHSWRGVALQVVNLCLGTMVYAPFVKMLDRRQQESAKINFEELCAFFRADEKKELCSLDGDLGMISNALAQDFHKALEDGQFDVFYQPQYSYEGHCIGVEALLRYTHPTYGRVLPPLLVKLAEESGFLLQMDCCIVDRVLRDRRRIQAQFGKDIKISVNVTGHSIMDPQYSAYMRSHHTHREIEEAHLMLELTEQFAVQFETSASSFAQLREMGITFAIDDFSMGQTSIDYLKNEEFALIKLDGSLTKGILDTPNCREIVSSISSLARSLNICVLAEYVETEEEKEALHQAGCDQYQGYLYSPAVPLEK